jgi:hypothetical protein
MVEADDARFGSLGHGFLANSVRRRNTIKMDEESYGTKIIAGSQAQTLAPRRTLRLT